MIGQRVAARRLRAQRRSGSWPVIVFALLSLAFGSAIVLANPPLRGPDEISHFLRIYSFTRGELLPAAEIDGRKGVFVERALYDRLYFFKNSGEWFATFLQQRKGEWFARTREEGVRYGRIMAEYRDTTRASGDEAAQAPVFAPFAGTEGYSPVAYAPCIIAAAVGRLLGLDLPELLFLMRFVGLVVFTAVTAYAIAVAPALKWAFVLIAMLPVSLYNRVVLSADGAALSYALVITALCFRAAWNPSAGRVWERSLWMTLCVLAKQPQIVFVLLELMAGRLRELPRRWSSLAIGLSDLFPHLHACRFAPCLGRSRTLLRHRLAYGCNLHGLVDQPRITARHAPADRDCRLNDCGNHDPGRGAASTLVMCQGPDMCSTPYPQFRAHAGISESLKFLHDLAITRTGPDHGFVGLGLGRPSRQRYVGDDIASPPITVRNVTSLFHATQQWSTRSS